MPLPNTDDIIGDRFVVGPILGKGCYGVVRAAKDQQSGDAVALKMLTPEAYSDPELVERFMREAKICAVLTHPNTVRLIDHGFIPPPTEGPHSRDPAVPYMAMDLVRGLPLGGLLSLRGRLSAVETSNILARVLDSLRDAHMNGIVHRDLKPNNIMVEAPADKLVPPTEGNNLFARLGIPGPDDETWKDVSELNVRVVDFGLGKLLEIGDREVKKLTQAGIGAGTAEYMSPEQVRGDPDIDHRADIYGVAMLIYRLITGKPCFDGVSRPDVAVKHITTQPPPLPGEFAESPLNAIYRKASAKKADDRYATVDEMAWELRNAVDEDYAAIQALMAEGVVARPEFEAPPEPRKPGEADDAGSSQDASDTSDEETDAAKPKKGLFSRLFGR